MATVRAYYAEGLPVNDITYLVHQEDREYWLSQTEEEPVSELVWEAGLDVETTA